MPVIQPRCYGEAVFNFATALGRSNTWRGISAQDRGIYQALSKDLKEFAFPNGDPENWFGLHPTYRKAWLDEIKRRIKGRELILLTNNEIGIGDETRYIMQNGALYGGSALPSILMFSQFKCNEHFQTNYGDSPEWISNKRIIEVAKDLRTNPGRSIDFRITVSLVGGMWIAWNNRGFTTHCLANVMPMRIVPNTTPSVDEQSRLGEIIELNAFRYVDSIPVSRRERRHWEPCAPCSVISVVDGAQGTDVLYTIKNGFQRDNGNETVFNTVH